MRFLNKFLYNLLAVYYEIIFHFTKEKKSRRIYDSYVMDYVNNEFLFAPTSTSNKEFVRKVMQNNFIGPYKWFNTGGSSGNPLGFFLHVKRRFIERVHQYFVWKFLMGWKGELIVTLDGSSQDSANRPNFPYGKSRIGNYSFRRDLNRLYVHIVNIKDGFYLRGYPSQCKSLLSDLITINDEETISRIKGLYLTSESVLMEELLWIFKYIPKDRVILQYGMSETAAFAIYDFKSECYRFSPFYSSISFRPMKKGYEILSNFNNGLYNFGTYQTSDYVAECDATRVWKRSGLILGRTTEYVLNKSKEKLELTGLVFGAHHGFFNLIDRWQIRNSAPGILEIHFSTQQKNKGIIEFELQEIFAPYDFQLEFVYDGDFIVSQNGKVHLVCH